MSNAAQILRLAADGMQPAKIAAQLEVSRQYVHQVLRKPEKDGGRVTHGTVARAATCSCAPCLEAKASYLRALPEVLQRMRAGESLASVGRYAGYNVVDMVGKARRCVEDGRPTLLGELVAGYEETRHLRGTGGPGRTPSKRAA